MSTNLGLYAVTALIILDNEGNRLYAKYYSPPKQEDESPLATLKAQQSFESALFSKTHKQHADIVLFQDKIVVYKETADFLIYIVGGLAENEVALFTVLEAFKDALEKILNYQMDKKAIQEHYDKVCIAVDETIDDGVILETEPSIIAARVSRAPKNEPTLKNLDLSEKGLMSAFQIGRGWVADKLQQNL